MALQMKCGKGIYALLSHWIAFLFIVRHVGLANHNFHKVVNVQGVAKSIHTIIILLIYYGTALLPLLPVAPASYTFIVSRPSDVEQPFIDGGREIQRQQLIAVIKVGT